MIDKEIIKNVVKVCWDYLNLSIPVDMEQIILQYEMNEIEKLHEYNDYKVNNYNLAMQLGDILLHDGYIDNYYTSSKRRLENQFFASYLLVPESKLMKYLEDNCTLIDEATLECLSNYFIVPKMAINKIGKEYKLW